MWTPNLRPVIATCWLVCQFVNGQGVNDNHNNGGANQISNITLSPPLANKSTAENEVYTIKWKDSGSSVFIVAAYLMQSTSVPTSGNSLIPSPLVVQNPTLQTIIPPPACPSTDPHCSFVILNPDTEQSTTFTLTSTVIVQSTINYQIQISYATLSVVPTTDPASRTFIVITGDAPQTGNTLSTTAPTIASTATSSINSAGVAGIAPSISSSSSPSSTPAATVANSDSSSGLSTGAKVGIAIGAVGFVLLVLIGALLFWRRSKQRQLRASSNGAPYTHDLSSTNRELTAEKEMNVMSSPVGLYTPTDTWNTGMTAVPEAPATEPAQTRSQTQSWAGPGEHVAPYTDDAAGPYTDDQRRSVHSPVPHEDPASQALVAPATAPVVQRKPVATVAGPTQHLREPGMSDEEIARLDEEERRLDEAIAEAERRRQQQR